MTLQSPLHELARRAGAVWVDEAGWEMPAHFGDVQGEYREACDGAVLFDLSHRSKCLVAGKDAVSWFHRICTNDLVNLKPGQSCEAFLATHKAKAVAYLRIFKFSKGSSEEVLLLDAAPGQAETVIKHLDRYIISEQVELVDHTQEMALLHLAGPNATRLGDGLSEQADRFRRFPNARLGIPGQDILCAAPIAQTLWESLTSDAARPAGLEAYELLRVEAGIPAWGKEIDDDRFVVEVNRIPQTICYTKGCYLGQEPIVMARDRGHVNRKLMGIKVGSDRPLPPGTRLFRDGNEVGQTTSSVVSPRFGAIALAYLRRGSDAPGTRLDVDSPGSGQTVEVASLPFGGGLPS